MLSFISAVSYVVLTFTKTVQFIFLLAYIPLVIHALFVYNNKEEFRLDAELKKVALSTFLFSATKPHKSHLFAEDGLMKVFSSKFIGSSTILGC